MSGTDQQQYNGTQAFPSTATVGTNADTFLLPTDGPIITADSNAANQSPANPGPMRLKDYYLGLRAATIGDFAGAVQKTVRSFFADGTGGNTHTVPAGELRASSHIQSTGGNMLVDTATGNFIGANGLLSGFLRIGGASPAQRLGGFVYGLFWGGTLTGANDANPPLGTSLKNELRAINVPKVAGFVDTNGGAPITEGFGFSVTVTNQTLSNGIGGTFTIPVIKVTFTDAFDNANYQVSTCGFDNMTLHIDKATRTTTFFYLYARDASGNFPSAAAGAGWTGGFSVFGKQTT